MNDFLTELCQIIDEDSDWNQFCESKKINYIHILSIMFSLFLFTKISRKYSEILENF
jgi:hypothetical protein